MQEMVGWQHRCAKKAINRSCGKGKTLRVNFAFNYLLFEGKLETSDSSTVFAVTVFANRKEFLERANNREQNF